MPTPSLTKEPASNVREKVRPETSSVDTLRRARVGDKMATKVRAGVKVVKPLSLVFESNEFVVKKANRASSGSGAKLSRRIKQDTSFKVLVSAPVDAPESIAAIRRTISAKVLSQAVAFLGVPQVDLLGAMKIPVSSFHRKLSGNLSLSSDETERVLRLADITRLATEAFGDAEAASAWLQTKNLALAEQSPLSMLDTDVGTSQVRRVLAVVNCGGVL